jgi:tellurium resistance protein TerD
MSDINLIKGQTTNIFELGKAPNLIDLEINWKISPDKFKMFEIDAFAFLLKKDEKVRNDLDFVFHNHLDVDKKMCVIQKWQRIKHNTTHENFYLKLNNVPNEIMKIVFCVSIYKASERKQSFNNLIDLEVTLKKDENIISNFKLEYTKEKITDMILCEVYKYKNNWKFRAVTQGFDGGIKKLENFYGVDE